MAADELGSALYELDILQSEVTQLQPRIIELRDDAEQRSLKTRLAEAQRHQHQLTEFVRGELNELWGRMTKVEKRRIELLAQAAETGGAKLDDLCKRLARIEKERLFLWGRIRIVSRYAGVEKPPRLRYLFGPGSYLRPDQASDPNEIRRALLGYGLSDGRGFGRKTTYGPQPRGAGP